MVGLRLATRSWEDCDYQMDSFGGDMMLRSLSVDYSSSGNCFTGQAMMFPSFIELKSKTEKMGIYLVSILNLYEWTVIEMCPRIKLPTS
jgi:hypothetical protein